MTLQNLPVSSDSRLISKQDRPKPKEWDADEVVPQCDHPDFNRFCEQLLANLVGYGFKKWGSSWRYESIEDIAADALLATLPHLRRCPDCTYRSFFSYNITTLKHKLINEYKVKSRSFERSITQFQDPYDTPHCNNLAKQTALSLELEEAFNYLSPMELEVVERKWNGYKIREIADRLEISPGRRPRGYEAR